MTYCLALGRVSSGYAKVVVLSELYIRGLGRTDLYAKASVKEERTTFEVAGRRILRAHAEKLSCAQKFICFRKKICLT